MIEFSCEKCRQKLNVEDKHSGKRVKCPKCGDVCVVPDNFILSELSGTTHTLPHFGHLTRLPECLSSTLSL